MRFSTSLVEPVYAALSPLVPVYPAKSPDSMGPADLRTAAEALDLERFLWSFLARKAGYVALSPPKSS